MEFDTSKYYLGSICKRGHKCAEASNLRLIKCGTCLQCKKDNDRARKQAKAAKLKESGEYDNTYLGTLCKRNHDEGNGLSLRMKRCGTCVKCKPVIHRKYYDDNADKFRTKAKTWYEKNPEKAKKTQSEWYESNKKIVLAYSRQWRKNNPEMRSEQAHRDRIRRKMKLELFDIIPSAQIKRLHELCNNECVYCGDRPAKLTLDHFKPLARGGTHTIDNLLLACGTCNSSKQDEDAFYWWTRKPFWFIDRYERAFEIMRSWKEQRSPSSVIL